MGVHFFITHSYALSQPVSMTQTLAIMCSLAFLMFIATGVFLLARRTRVPYTVLLVVVGLLLIPLSKFEALSFLSAFRLTPDVLFYVFLPPLIFESAYNMHIRRVMENIWGISLLSIVSLLISTFAIAGLLHIILGWFGFAVPFSVTLLFGALISATDPVAVLALFKEYGAPKRLTLLFEGESLFNDGTAVALFVIILGVLVSGWHGATSVIEGTLSFFGMVGGGALWGALVAFCFHKILSVVKKDEYLEITLTMVIAHFTFISADLIGKAFQAVGYEFHLSAIIATTIAAMAVGNFGRYQLTPRVAEYMERFWGYFAFVTNSLVFILIGLLLTELTIDMRTILLPAVIAVLVVMFARALSIYPVIGLFNKWGKEEYVPMSWQHLLAWGSLRGALAITMVLLIPPELTVAGWGFDFSVRDFLVGLTITCMYFTLFIKATTIGPLIRKLKIDALTPLEHAEQSEVSTLLYAKVLLEIERFHKKHYITDEMHDTLKEKYALLFREASTASINLGGVSEALLHLYATGHEKHSLRTLHEYEEVSEVVHKIIFADLAERQHHIEHAAQVPSLALPADVPTALKKPEDIYMYYRARVITAGKAREELEKLMQNDQLFDIGILKSVFDAYIKLVETAQKRMDGFAKMHPDAIEPLQHIFAEAGLYKAKDKILADLLEKEVVTPKIAANIRTKLFGAKN